MRVQALTLPGIPVTDALLNEFAPDRPLTAAEVECGKSLRRAGISRPMKPRPRSSGCLRNITAEWSKATGHWKGAMNQFAILYGDRFLKGPP
jgi:hypothetical protein